MANSPADVMYSHTPFDLAAYARPAIAAFLASAAYQMHLSALAAAPLGGGRHC
jgi:hypothetical protein